VLKKWILGSLCKEKVFLIAEVLKTFQTKDWESRFNQHRLNGVERVKPVPHQPNSAPPKRLQGPPNGDLKKGMLCSVVGLRLGGPEARPKRGPSDDIIMLSQPWYALLIKPKIRPLKDTFLRLWHDRNSRRECKRVFMIHNFENTESSEDKASNT